MSVVRILRRLLSAESIGLILILIALQTLAYGISSSLRGIDMRQSVYFGWVCLLAALIAYGFNKLNWNGIQASLGMLALGLIGVWILGARLATPLVDLVQAVLSVTPQILPAIRSDVPIDTTAINDSWLVVAEASNALSARVQTWLVGFDRNVTVNDALVRNMVWVLILWLISAWVGWFSARRQAIASLLPSIVLLALITSYSERRVETLWLMVFLLLLLMGIWNYKNHTTQWERRKVDYSDSILYDVSQAVILLSVAVGVLAFITPSISWRQIRDYLRERGQNEVAESLGVQQQQVPARAVPGPKPALPREHLLSGGNAQSEEIVMTIRTGELPPLPSSVLTTQAPRYYWRSTTYDTYVGAGWVTRSALAKRYEANTPLIPGLLNGYRTLHLDVALAQPEGKLFWSGILFSADVPLRADWRLRPPSDLFADQSALLQADMFIAASAATTYSAQAYVPLVTVKELRAASTAYPSAIQDHYLQLPRSLPERVMQLAQEITKDQTTAYDKAKAIELYLRSYPYDLEVPAPPEDQDVADYFLFDLKKGYCDYYATAMVVLARASGLPARFVSGYASGSYDAENAEYIVRELHAHSWPEIYFPEIGWIEFEPTAAQPEIEIPPSNEGVTTTTSDETATRLLNRFRLETLLYWLSPVGIILLGLLLYFAWIERWLYLRLPPEVAVERIYRRLYRLGRPLAGERTKAETANEFRGKLIDAMDSMRGHSPYSNYLATSVQEVKYLTDMYQYSLFAHPTVNRVDVRNALPTWKGLRWRLLLARLHRVMKNFLSRQSLRRNRSSVKA
jgi:transglutaminase-like putative cysteine protease